MATWAPGIASPTQADVMAAFSSRGPLGDFIKPDVTAPGIQVLAGMTPPPDNTTPTNGPPGNLYQAIAGTSMSWPHAAGVSALVKAAHPTGRRRDQVGADDLIGAGRRQGGRDDARGPVRRWCGLDSRRSRGEPDARVRRDFDDFVASAGDPLHRIDLNIASVNAPTMTGLITTKRTAINVTGKSQQLEVSTVAPPGVSIFVSDKPPGKNGPKADPKIQLAKNGTTDIWITISAPEVPNGQYFGQITLDPKKDGYNSAVIPVAFNKHQGVVTLTHICVPTTIVAKVGSSACAASVTNFGSLAADVSLTVTNLSKGNLDYTNISAPATAIKKDDGVQWSGTLTPTVPPQIDALTDISGGGPAGGYLPLSLFGIGPIAGVGDDTITNFNVPTFYYGGETYTRIGVVSNGYLVVGGGTSADIVFTPQHFPNPARPNNVLALSWTDLNPAAAGAIRIGTLTDGANTWIVVDYDSVKNFGTADMHSFEVWIQIAGGAAGAGPESEEITFSYGPTTGMGDPDSGSNWGAENRDGSSGANIAVQPTNGKEYSVDTSAPTAGGSTTITYNASSKKVGTYKSQAAMTSNVTPGTTEVVQTITVTPP